ncbi:MAG: 16S rRNA (cytosine(1402)-N(4))-methyltransferase RsmH [Candidatus Andersenbacteria bacterium]
MHTPVLPQEVLTYLAPQPGQTIVDATFGAGGHTQVLLDRLGPNGKILGLDRDASAIAAGKETFAAELKAGRLELLQARFSELAQVVKERRVQVDGVVIDAGVSSTQLLSPTRGFSFTRQAPLDMRMDPSRGPTAAELLAEWSEERLREQLHLVGERAAARIARAVVRARAESPIQRTDQLADLIESAVPPRGRARGVHVATKTFLALRLAVNDELQQLQAGLNAALTTLRPGGRLVVISFQSLEDGLVKKQLKEWAAGCICPPELPVCRCGHDPLAKILTKKPVTPTPHERATNPRARSAKLRACQKL